MATITSLSQLAKNSVSSIHFLLTASTSANNKFLLQDLFPTLATLGNGEPVAIGVTNKNQLNFKGISSVNNLLTVATASNNITLQVNQANINLANCNNTTSAFLNSVSLSAAYVTGTLPVSKGGTGAGTLTSNSLLLGNGTSAFTALGAATNGQIPIGSTGSSPVLATLTAGSGITITNAAGAITIASSVGTGNANLNLGIYNIYGTGWFSGDGGNEGIKINSNGQVFVGGSTPTAFHSTDLNVNNGISLNGAVTNGIAMTSASNPQQLYITGSQKTGGGGIGGEIAIEAGKSFGANRGGDITIAPGTHDGSGSSGRIYFKGWNSAGSIFDALSILPRLPGFAFVGINQVSPSHPLEVAQTDTAAGIATLKLTQADTDQPFIYFSGTSGALSANSVSSATTSTGAKVGAIRININGTDRWIRLYDTAE
jgi:hypothetical protein